MITKLHDKNKILDKYIEIIKQNNFKSSDILVFVDNNINRLEYIKKIELKISEELKICTYSQFVRGEIITYWPIILNDCEIKRNKENYFDDITGTNKSIASNIMNNLDNAIYNQIDYKKIGKKIYNSKANKENIKDKSYIEMEKIIEEYLNEMISNSMVDDSINTYL